MARSTIDKTLTLLADRHATSHGSRSEIQTALNRGMRDLGRRGKALQALRAFTTVSGTRVYSLPSDHVDTFAILVEPIAAPVSVRILDQVDFVWYLTVTPAGDLGFADSDPGGTILSESDDIYWLEIDSADSTTWYVYPSSVGDIKVDIAAPAVGTGTDETVELYDTDGFPWYPGVTNAGDASASPTGSAILTATAGALDALERTEPQSHQRIDPRETSGRPRYYALAGRSLELHPTPDAPYLLTHYYFADDADKQVDAWRYLATFFATAVQLQRRGRIAPGQQLLQIYTTHTQLLGANLWPGSRDGASIFHLPGDG